MATYRIYYAERDPNAAVATSRYAGRVYSLGREVESNPASAEVEWEETVDADSAPEALDAFFGDHVRNRSEVMWVDDDGESHAMEGEVDYNPDMTYIWVEKEKLMEYQGLDEATPGLVVCPLCDGHGEVEPEAAEAYMAGVAGEPFEG